MNLELMPHLELGYRLQFEKVLDKPLLLYPEGIVELSESAFAILELCDGKTTIKQIIATLEARYDESALEADVVQFMKEAVDNGWLNTGAK